MPQNLYSLSTFLVVSSVLRAVGVFPRWGTRAILLRIYTFGKDAGNGRHLI